jgi:type I restriction-modification system DNA methylase subunit
MSEELFITREDLKDYIHSIHNFLRNNGAGYGAMGMKIFNVFYGLKLIQPYLDKLNLTDEQKQVLDFNELVKKAYNNNIEIIAYIDNDVLDLLYDLKCNDDNDISDNLGHFIYHQIPRDLKDNVWKELIKKIEKIPVGYSKERKVNLSGKVYEYFVGRDKNSISELGAYFTDRHITDFIYNKLQPTLDDNNNIKTMIDPFGGSGGFTLGYAFYLRNNFDNIDWSDNVNNIYHFDMEESVINMTGLEMFAITGAFPKRELNYSRENSFTYEFPDTIHKYKKYNYVISNPPYGGDKINISAEQQKRNKLITYIKSLENKDDFKDQLKELVKISDDYKKNQEKQQVNLDNCSKRITDFAIKYKLNGNDKEACSLMLLADLVDTNGTACLVLKEGVFFDNRYSNLRKAILENYNVTNIISVPQNAFENTSTNTSIIIFHNNGKTKNVVFSELVVEKEKKDVFEIINDKVYLTNNKDEIKNVYEKELCYATIEQISKMDYSFNFKNYLNNYHHFVFVNDNKIEYLENYELVKLNDIIKFKPKSKRPASFGQTKGKYRFYSSSDKIKYCNECDFNDDKNLYLIFGSGGEGSLFIDNHFSCSGDNIFGTVKDKLSAIYIYSYIKTFWKEFIYFHFNGSTMRHIKKENLLITQLPIPKDINTIKSELEYLYNLHQNITNNQIKIKEDKICDLIKTLTQDGDNYDEYKLGDICEFNPQNKKLVSDYVEYLDITNCLEFKTVKLKNNKSLLPSRAKRTPIINDVILSSVRPANKNINIIKKYNYVDNLIISTGYIIIRTTKVNSYYIYLYLNNDNTTQILINKSTGSGYPAIKPEHLYDITIPILKSNIMKEHKLEKLFDEVDKLKDKLESDKKEYDIKLKELFKDFKLDDINDSQFQISEENDTIPTNIQELVETNESSTNVTSTNSTNESSTSSIKLLHEQCKSLGIKGYSKYKKTEDKDKLLKLIEEHK